MKNIFKRKADKTEKSPYRSTARENIQTGLFVIGGTIVLTMLAASFMDDASPYEVQAQQVQHLKF